MLNSNLILLSCMILSTSGHASQTGGSQPAHHDVHFPEDIISPEAEHVKMDFETIFGFMFGDFTEEDLQFSYFTIHDYDHNSKLDGLELMSALRHVNHSKSVDDHNHPERTLEQDLDTVDLILSEDDKNNDGFISFAEYKVGRQVKKAVK